MIVTEDLEEVIKAFNEINPEKLTMSEVVELMQLTMKLKKFMERMIIKHSNDLPEKSTFLFKIGDE